MTHLNFTEILSELNSDMLHWLRILIDGGKRGRSNMKRERRKWTAAALAAVMTVTLLPFSAAADPQAEKAGVPYSADGTYDVAIPHIIVNQVY